VGKSFLRFKSIVFILRLEDLYLEREDPSTLLRIYQRALRNNPDDWVTTFFYAKLCLRLEMLDEALEALDELSLRQKDFPSLHRLLAEIHLHQKDFSRAAREFEKTFKMSGISYLPYYCSSCGRDSQDWAAFCPGCHRWNTYGTKAGEQIVTLFPSTVSERRASFCKTCTFSWEDFFNSFCPPSVPAAEPFSKKDNPGSAGNVLPESDALNLLSV